MNSCRNFILELARLFRDGKKLRPGVRKKTPRRSNRPARPTALIFSPHPDDECIVGGLALRLLREAGWNVINVAVTLGGKRERRTRRLRELQNACGFLGFDLVSLGLEKINPITRQKNRKRWLTEVEQVKDVLKANKPRVIFFPHERDGHPTHVGVHFLVLDALKKMPRDFECFIVETEFWGQMTEPNLLVESGVEDVGDLVAALACHVGEMRRNPYHARLPAWMLDNVRRAELMDRGSSRRSGSVREGGQGGAAPDFTFGTIYRLQKWSRGRLINVLRSGKFLSAAQNPVNLFGT